MCHRGTAGRTPLQTMTSPFYRYACIMRLGGQGIPLSLGRDRGRPALPFSAPLRCCHFVFDGPRQNAGSSSCVQCWGELLDLSVAPGVAGPRPRDLNPGDSLTSPQTRSEVSGRRLDSPWTGAALERPMIKYGIVDRSNNASPSHWTVTPDLDSFVISTSPSLSIASAYVAYIYVCMHTANARLQDITA